MLQSLGQYFSELILKSGSMHTPVKMVLFLVALPLVEVVPARSIAGLKVEKEEEKEE